MERTSIFVFYKFKMLPIEMNLDLNLEVMIVLFPCILPVDETKNLGYVYQIISSACGKYYKKWKEHQCSSFTNLKCYPLK